MWGSACDIKCPGRTHAGTCPSPGSQMVDLSDPKNRRLNGIERWFVAHVAHNRTFHGKRLEYHAAPSSYAFLLHPHKFI
jgi:hypothetical protein